jgi:hypothetical protein
MALQGFVWKIFNRRGKEKELLLAFFSLSPLVLSFVSAVARGEKMSSGIYFYYLKCNNNLISSKRMILLK